ncbi:MAG: wax ester/triacylglycerol synthase family O-acyltransferase [Acidimicrobiales bacterium]|nr:wax ester/triacylglycerol synthase family O-acyltransferase [Acidimicrobiales bacterium]HRW37664.1 wax ester/triacylglycerol synthase family O-acyltransferase [Aquihabitans sp.]
MQRLAGSDTGFLFIETPGQTSVCVDMVHLAPRPDGEALTLDGLHRWIEARLPLLPSWRWRLQDVPLQVHHPLWIEDPDFDLGYHLREHTLPAPGGDDEVEAYHAEVLPQLLDRRHPLWRITLVHGLAGDRQALLFQIHHTLADGAAILFTMAQLFHELPDGPLPEVPAPEHPTRSALLRQGLRDQARAWRAIPSMYRETKARFHDVEARRAEEHPPVPRPMGDAPGTVLNLPGPPRRVTARARLPLADLQQVRRAVGCTMNDVALAMVGGGLRSYLLERDQLPEGSLVANCPVSGDPPGTPPRQWGNRFANFFCFLGTDVADTRERLDVIAAGTAEAKVLLETQGHFTLTEWLERIPPFVGRRAARWMIDRNAADTTKADYNVLLSNVRFTDADFAVDGHDVEAIHLTGPIGDDAGLNVTVVGYRDVLHLTIDASPVAIDDPRALADAFRLALEELVACTA